MNNQYNIQSGDTLSGIAQQKGTTVNEIMKLNPSISDPNKISAGANIYIPNVSSTNTQVALPENRNIDIQNVANPQQPVNIPEQSNTDLNAISNSAQNVLAQLYNLQAKQTEETLKQQQRALDPLYQQQTALQNQILNRGQEQLRLEQEAGIDTQSKALAQLQGAIAQQSAKFIGEQYNLSAAGNPITASVARKNDAMQLALMTASAQSMTGNLQAAQQSIDNAINLKYTDTLNALQFTKEYIARNEDIMSSAQKSLAETRSKLVDFQIKQMENDRKELTSIIKEASAAGASSDLLSEAIQTDSPLEAARILSGYSKDYWEIEKLKYDLGVGTSGSTVSSLLGDGYGSILGYDITSYATDPNHERNVANIIAGLDGVNGYNPVQLDSAINAVAPNSKINGQMIIKAAKEYNVDPKMIYAILQADSHFGTKGMGATNNNPGNVAQFDNLTSPVKGYATMQEGVNAVAKWLSNHRVQDVQKQTAEAGAKLLKVYGSDPTKWKSSGVSRADQQLMTETLSNPQHLAETPQAKSMQKILDITNKMISAYELGGGTIPTENLDYYNELSKYRTGIQEAVGGTRFERIGLNFGAKNMFLGDLAQLMKKETLETYQETKETGGSMGAMSSSEWKILSDASSALSNSLKMDGDTLKAVRLDEKDFIRIITKLRDETLNNYNQYIGDIDTIADIMVTDLITRQ